MPRRATPKRHEQYAVHVTEEFVRSVEATYERFLDENPAYADVWLDRIQSCIAGLERPAWLGNIDPEYYSGRYSHIQVPGTQTTIFLLVEDDQIYLITSGWSGRNWSEVLRLIEPELERQLQKIKEE